MALWESGEVLDVYLSQDISPHSQKINGTKMRGRKPRVVVSSCPWSLVELRTKEHLPGRNYHIHLSKGAHPEVNKEVEEAQGTQNEAE